MSSERQSDGAQPTGLARVLVLALVACGIAYLATQNFNTGQNSGAKQPGVTETAPAGPATTVGVISLVQPDAGPAHAQKKLRLAVAQRPAPVDARLLAAAVSRAAIPETPNVARPQKARGKKSDRLQRVGRSVGARGRAIDNPCRRYIGPDCVETALQYFFASLDLTAAKKQKTRIVVFGNSLIASDRIIDIWRARLVERFGDGGRGLLLADRMAPYGGRSRTGVGAHGLRTYNIAQGPIGPWPHALAGVLHYSSGRAQTKWWVRGHSRAQLLWLDHQSAPPLHIQIDGGERQIISPLNSGQGRILDVTLPPGARALHLRIPRGRAVLYGVLLEKPEPGVIVNTIGVVASDSTIFLKEEETLFKQQLLAINPDLVTVMLGGNETKRVAWGKSKPERVRADLHGFLQRIKRTTPRSSCLVVGPIENVRGKDRARPWSPRWQLFLINRIMREVAIEEGCAWFDLFAAMGGRGQLQRLHARGLLHDDMVHPKGRGLDLPGELVSDALLDLYEATSPPPLESLVVDRWRPLSGGSLKNPTSAIGDVLRRRATSAPMPLAIGKPKSARARAVVEGLIDHLRHRFGLAGSGMLTTAQLQQTTFRGAIKAVAFSREEALTLKSGRKVLTPKQPMTTVGAWKKSSFDVRRRSGLKVSSVRGQKSVRTPARKQNRDEPAPDAKIRISLVGAYPGVAIDDLASVPADLVLAQNYGAAIVAGDESQTFRAWEGTPCLSLLLPGAMRLAPGCQTFDVVSQIGGKAWWRQNALLEDEQLTEAGVKAAVRLIVGAVFAASDLNSTPGDAG